MRRDVVGQDAVCARRSFTRNVHGCIDCLTLGGLKPVGEAQLIIDSTSLCADTCVVPALPYHECGNTFQRLVVVGDAAQLPPFTRLRGDDAPLS